MHRCSIGNEASGHTAENIHRRYEEKNKEKSRAKCGNFQTMIPRDLFEKINLYLKERGIIKVELVKAGYEALHARSATI